MSRGASRRLLAGLVAVSASLVVFSCIPEEKHRLLTFFFDGVPDLRAPGKEPEMKPASAAVGATAPRPKPSSVVWYEHEATTDNAKCGACHDRNASYALLKPPLGLCVTCHEKETREFPRMHGPVAVGDCAACHEAHRSPYKHLVRAPGAKLCLGCHERTPEAGQALGCARPSDDVDCVKCHNPHGGAGAFFLADRPSGADSPREDPPPPSSEVR